MGWFKKTGERLPRLEVSITGKKTECQAKMREQGNKTDPATQRREGSISVNIRRETDEGRLSGSFGFAGHARKDKKAGQYGYNPLKFCFALSLAIGVMATGAFWGGRKYWIWMTCLPQGW